MGRELKKGEAGKESIRACKPNAGLLRGEIGPAAIVCTATYSRSLPEYQRNKHHCPIMSGHQWPTLMIPSSPLMVGVYPQ